MSLFIPKYQNRIIYTKIIKLINHNILYIYSKQSNNLDKQFDVLN